MKAIFFAFSLQFLCTFCIGQNVLNVTTSVSYTSLNAALVALPDGGSGNVIYVYQPQSLTYTFAKNYTNLSIIGIGQPTLDCLGGDTFLAFNGTGKTLQSITIDNFRIINNNTNTSNAAALRYLYAGGTNVLRRITFSGCSIPVRATTQCGNFLMEDCVAVGYTSGVFRYGLGSQTGVNPNVPDMGWMVARRCYFDGTNNANTEAELVWKRMTGGLVEDCIFKNSSKYAISIYDPALTAGNVLTIRRCQFIGGHAKATSGGTIDFSPNVTTGAGRTQAIRIESNVFDGDKGQMVQVTAGDLAYITNNVFIEGAGDVASPVSFTNSKNLRHHYNNMYVGITGNNSGLLSLGTMTYDSLQLNSNNNVFYKVSGSGRALISGTTTGTYSATLTTYTLATLQAKSQDANSLNTLPTFNTTQKKFSPYFLAFGSPGINGASTTYPQSHRISGFTVTTQDIGRFTLRRRRYTTGRSRIVKPN